MKTVFRISFDEAEGKNLEFLLDRLGISRPQNLIRQLVTEAAIKQRELDLRYGNGPKAPTTPRTNAHQRRKMLEALDDATLTEKLKPLLDKEFRQSEADEIRVFSDPTTGQRQLYIKIISPAGGYDEANANLSYYLNQWQKDKSLDAITSDL